VQPAPAILIVDDHDGFRRFVRGMLKAAGFTVAEAARRLAGEPAAGLAPLVMLAGRFCS
jgi:CheY-like chemotaxis protein